MIVSHQFAKLLVYMIALLFCFVSSKSLYAMSWSWRGNDFGVLVRTEKATVTAAAYVLALFNN